MFARKAEKGNCKFEPQKCNSVFEVWFGTLHTHKPLLRREHFSLNTETRFLRGEKALAPFRNEGIFYCPLYVTLTSVAATLSKQITQVLVCGAVASPVPGFPSITSNSIDKILLSKDTFSSFCSLTYMVV